MMPIGWPRKERTVLTKIAPDDCVVVGNLAYILKRDGVLVNEKL